MGNGTLALMATFACLGIGPGDEVITVAHTFAATANAILSTGATPVFVDIEPDTYLIDAKRIEAAITPRTRAIAPVHLFGLVADMDMIGAIADRHGLVVVEDACQAHGATSRPAGRELRERDVQPLRDEEHDDRRGRPHHDERRPGGPPPALPQPGHAGPLPVRDTRLQLPDDRYQRGDRPRPADKLEGNTARRQRIAAAYDEGFAGLPVRTPVVPVGRTHVYHQYTVEVGPGRDAILAALRDGGCRRRHLLPDPRPSPGLLLERGLHADLPVTDRPPRRRSPCRCTRPDRRDEDTVIAVVIERRSGRARSRRTPGSPARA